MTDYQDAIKAIQEARAVSKQASDKLVDSMGQTHSWFPHRLSLLDPERYWKDYWTISADHVVRHLPLDSMLLDLCCGDGFYDRFWYSQRAQSIIAIDSDPVAIHMARLFHFADNIVYLCGDILKDLTDFSAGWDVISMRGAIEHFDRAEQQEIFHKVKAALGPGGVFVGDTALPGGPAPHHKFEWANIEQAYSELGNVFQGVKVEQLVSRERVTLLWRAW